jgi:hypothetical protein
MKIIQIDGIRGLLTAAFVGVCLFAGFVMFPGLVAMSLWNKYLVNLYMFPVISLFQGILLWGILAISYCIITKNKFALSFKNTPELSDEELSSIIKSAKINAHTKMINKIISQSDKFINKEEEKNSIEKDSFVSSPISSNEKIQRQETSNADDEKISKIN